MKSFKISFDPLWKTLIDHHMNKKELAERTGLSRVTVAKMGRNENVTLEVIGRICQELEVSICDVVEIKVVDE